MLISWKKNYNQPRQHIKKQRHYFANKGPSRQSYGFSSGHVWMWELDYKESWVPKNWCFWTVVLKIQPVHPKGNQPWIFIGSTDWCWSWKSGTLATSCEELTLWKRPWCSEILKAGWKGDNREWDGWVASLIQWTWVWASSWSWWWTGKPGMLQSMGLQSWTWLSDWIELNNLWKTSNQNFKY